MKKVLLAVVGVLVLAVVAILGIASTKPDTFHVERTAMMTAPPATVFAMVNDFHRWPEWSPWEKLDPNMQRTHTGPPSGVGASYAWVGNQDAGEGRMTIIESQPDARIAIRLEFIKPWESTCTAAFAFTPAAEGTEVRWTMDGKNDFVAKIFCVFMDMDKMIGKDFDAGLATMKTLAEQTPAAADSSSLGGAP